MKANLTRGLHDLSVGWHSERQHYGPGDQLHDAA
jgi:hypothetical protein